MGAAWERHAMRESALTSWNPQDLSRPVMGFLYLLLYLYVVLMMNCVTCVETSLARKKPLISIDFCFSLLLTFQSLWFMCVGFNVLVILQANTAFQTVFCISVDIALYIDLTSPYFC